MATFQVPYEGRSIRIPDDGQVFRSSDNPSPVLYVRKGNTIYSVNLEGLGLSLFKPSTQYPEYNYLPADQRQELGRKYLQQTMGVDFDSIPAPFTQSTMADWENTLYSGGNFQKAGLRDLSLVKSQPTTQNEVITQTINPENPQGVIVTSNTSGELQRSKSTYETLIEAGATPEQAASLSAQASLSPYSTQQITNAGLTPPTAGSTTELIDSSNPLSPILNALDSQLTQLEQRGKVLNPAIDITPEKMAEFLTQAKSEINPYYSTLLNVARENLLRSAGLGIDEIREAESALERTYGQAFRTLGESAADRGFATSGIRQREEKELAMGTQDAINQSRRTLATTLGSDARAFAGEFGGAQIPGSPSLSAAPTVSAGEGKFGRSVTSLPVYNISDSILSGLKGTRQFQEEADITSRTAELESAERERLALQQGRALAF